VFAHGGNVKKLLKLREEYLIMFKENQRRLERQLEDRVEQIVKLEMK
jgi:hypothetical protein